MSALACAVDQFTTSFCVVFDQCFRGFRELVAFFDDGLRLISHAVVLLASAPSMVCSAKSASRSSGSLPHPPTTPSISRARHIATRRKCFICFMGISPWGKDSGQERLQCSPQSKLLRPRQGDKHDQHAAGRKTCERHWVLLLKKVCGNEKSPALQASLSEMTERRGFELEFQGLGELSVSLSIMTPIQRLFRSRTSLRLLQTSACVFTLHPFASAACFSIVPDFGVHCRRWAGCCKMAAKPALFDPVLLAEPDECLV